MNAKRILVSAIAVFSLVGVLGFTPAASARVRVGIGIGLGFPTYYAPPPLRREVGYASPGPGYSWVNGYWDWRTGLDDYVWVGGRWVLPSYYDSYWIAPYYAGGYYYPGRWGRGFNRGFRGHDNFAFRGGFRGHDGYRGGFRGHESFHGGFRGGSGGGFHGNGGFHGGSHGSSHGNGGGHHRH